MNLPVGTKLQDGNYVVGKVLAQGGFGIVYSGSDTNLKRLVAIKEFFPLGCSRQDLAVASGSIPLVSYEHARNKFQQEAEMLASLDHRGIVRVHACFSQNNTAYMVMEFLQGKTLQQMVDERGALPERESTRIIEQVGAALATVHEAGWIYRDINPNNIMLCNDGRVVLIDFGLNRKLEEATNLGTRRLTHSMVMLTPGYAPQEQYSQHTLVGTYTDVYAMGATLYFLLTAQDPVDAPARSAGIVLAPPHLLKPHVSRRASDAVMQAMATAGSDRPQTTAHFLGMLTSNPRTAQSSVLQGLPPDLVSGGTMSTLKVSPHVQGLGYFTSISDAIMAAAPGQRITVAPGLYTECLVLDKPIEIAGEGGQGQVIVQSGNGSSIVMATTTATVHGLTLRCTAGQHGVDVCGIDIPQGALVLNECDITSDTSVGVRICEAGNPTITGCTIHDCDGPGIMVHDHGQGTIENCDIFGNGLSNITIRDSGNATLTNCTIHHSRGCGILFPTAGRGTIERCDIFDNEMSNVAIAWESDPVLKDCSIRGSKEFGVVVHDHGQGTLENCDIFNNEGCNVALTQGSNPTFTHCAIYDSESSGVVIREFAQGTFEDCDIFGNALSNVGIDHGGNPIMKRCTIHDGQDCGVVVTGYSQGIWEDCDMIGHRRSGVAITHGGVPTIRGCTIRANKEHGVFVLERSAGILEDCDISANDMCGVEIRERGEATLLNCRINGNAEFAVRSGESGRGTITGCDLSGNVQGSTAISSQASVAMVNNRQ